VFNDKKFLKNIVKERKDNVSKPKTMSRTRTHRLTQLQNERLCVRPTVPRHQYPGEAIKILALSLAVRR
jgi:uncharacterized heparinase superfamily protein